MLVYASASSRRFLGSRKGPRPGRRDADWRCRDRRVSTYRWVCGGVLMDGSRVFWASDRGGRSLAAVFVDGGAGMTCSC